MTFWTGEIAPVLVDILGKISTPTGATAPGQKVKEIYQYQIKFLSIDPFQRGFYQLAGERAIGRNPHGFLQYNPDAKFFGFPFFPKPVYKFRIFIAPTLTSKARALI